MIGIAINPTTDIYYDFSKPFTDHVEGSDYIVYFFPPALGGWYECEQISISLKSSPTKNICLDDFAFSWAKGDISSLKFTIESFESQDFLEQLCITYLIARLRKEYNQSTKTNKSDGFLAQYLRKRVKENKDILDIFLKVLISKIKYFSEIFSKEYNIDCNTVLSVSLMFASISITGENRKVIDDLILKYKENPKDKKVIRAHDRTLRITPFETPEKNRLFNPTCINREGKEIKKRTDIKSMAEASHEVFIESLFIMSKEGDPCNMLVPVMLDAISKDKNLSDLTTLTINRNSERIYTPNSKYSLVSFIFGHGKGNYSRLHSYLRDTLLRKTYIQDEIDENKSYKFPAPKNKYWKKHSKWQDETSEEKKRILAELSFLSPKQYLAVEKQLVGFGGLTTNERQNLTKARKQIKNKGFDIDI